MSTKLEPGPNHGRVRFLIAGMARSGTTVGQRLITEIDGVWVPAETHFWRYAAGMARRFLFPLDREQATSALQWFADLDSSRQLSFDPAEIARALPDRSFQWDMFVALVRALSPLDADLLGEKTPDHLRWAEQLLTAVPDLCLVGLIRDPREVYRSHCSVPWGITDPFAFAEKWLELSRRLRDCKRLFADRVLATRYEDMVADPTAFQKQAASLLDPGATRPITARTDLIGLFPPDETWKAGALEPVTPREDRWASELPRHAVRILESACRDEMVSWGYEPTTQEGSHFAPPSLAETRRIRTAAERIDTVPLPITEQQVAEWIRSDAHAAAVLEVTVRLPRQPGREPATRQATASRELAAARGALDLWRARAEVLQGEESRLRKQLTEEQILRLRSERAQLVAEGHHRRLQARRWWRLGQALGAWRQQPWRLDRLVRSCWALRVRSALPPMPSLSAIHLRLAELGANPAAAEQGGDRGLQEATQLYRKGEYETTLARLEELAPATRSSRGACLIARDCHIKLGELHAALADVRRALEAGPDKALERQARQLVGRIRETDPSWLPDAGPPLDSYRPVDARRVLHIVKESLPFFERGFTLRSQATFLAQREAGFDPVVVTSLGFPRQQGFDSFPPIETIDGIEHHRLDLGPTYNLRDVPFDLQLSDQAILTRELAERVRPGLIQAGSGYRGFETALVGLAVARCLGVPFIYEVRSFLEHTWTAEIERSESGEHYHRRRRQELRCMLEADHVITIAEGMRDHIVARGVPAEKVSVVPNVVDVDRFTPRAADPELQRKYGIDGRPVLGYISNLGQREGIEHLIRAVAILRDRGTDVAGLVVGEGPSGEELERLVGELGLTGHVMLTGHVDNHRIEDHYAMIDLFVIPRIDDLASRLVVPLKPLEAMAMQRPVVAADLPALRELVAPGERGEVFPPGNPEALAAVAERLINDPDQRARLARTGRSWVLRERTIAANARRYEQTLLTAAGGGR